MLKSFLIASCLTAASVQAGWDLYIHQVEGGKILNPKSNPEPYASILAEHQGRCEALCATGRNWKPNVRTKKQNDWCMAVETVERSNAEDEHHKVLCKLYTAYNGKFEIPAASSAEVLPATSLSVMIRNCDPKVALYDRETLQCKPCKTFMGEVTNAGREYCYVPDVFLDYVPPSAKKPIPGEAQAPRFPVKSVQECKDVCQTDENCKAIYYDTSKVPAILYAATMDQAPKPQCSLLNSHNYATPEVGAIYRRLNNCPKHKSIARLDDHDQLVCKRCKPGFQPDEANTECVEIPEPSEEEEESSDDDDMLPAKELAKKRAAAAKKKAAQKAKQAAQKAAAASKASVDFTAKGAAFTTVTRIPEAAQFTAAAAAAAPRPTASKKASKWSDWFSKH